MIPRIAISGRMKAGKTTAANVLVQEFGFTKMALADQLKEVSRDIGVWLSRETFRFGRDVGNGEDYECLNLLAYELNDKDCPLGRAWLQWLGQRMRRVHQDVWVDALLSRIPDCPCVVDDVRFVNEATRLTEEGFILIRIRVSPEIQRTRLPKGFPPDLLSDPSETELDDLSEVTVFNGDLPKDEFERGVLEWARWRFRQ